MHRLYMFCAPARWLPIAHRQPSETAWTVQSDHLVAAVPPRYPVTADFIAQILEAVDRPRAGNVFRLSPVPGRDHIVAHMVGSAPPGPAEDAAAAAEQTAGGETPSWQKIAHLKPGGRSSTIEIGLYMDEYGDQHYPVVRKATHAFGPRDKVRRLDSNWESLTTVEIDPWDTLWWLRGTTAGAHTNVITILGLEATHPQAPGSSTPDTTFVYSPWYPAGDLSGEPMQRYGREGLLEILRGAFEGLYVINGEWGKFHGDIKPGNVFVDITRTGLLIGLIGDPDDLVNLKDCDPDTDHIAGTPCYGAPFKQCDPRRDQVALVVTAFETLAEDKWHIHCQQSTAADDLPHLGY